MEISERSEIDAVIKSCDDAFDDPVCRRATYPVLLEKIHQKGKFAFAYNGTPLGYCAFYANDSNTKNAYISLIAVAPEYQKMHIGAKLLDESLATMRAYGMKQCLLEVRKSNHNAFQFYQTKHFTMVGERAESYLMMCEL